jgi:hypothetical protein
MLSKIQDKPEILNTSYDISEGSDGLDRSWENTTYQSVPIQSVPIQNPNAYGSTYINHNASPATYTTFPNFKFEIGDRVNIEWGKIKSLPRKIEYLGNGVICGRQVNLKGCNYEVYAYNIKNPVETAIFSEGVLLKYDPAFIDKTKISVSDVFSNLSNVEIKLKKILGLLDV